MIQGNAENTPITAWTMSLPTLASPPAQARPPVVRVEEMSWMKQQNAVAVKGFPNPRPSSPYIHPSIHSGLASMSHFQTPPLGEGKRGRRLHGDDGKMGHAGFMGQFEGKGGGRVVNEELRFIFFKTPPPRRSLIH